VAAGLIDLKPRTLNVPACSSLTVRASVVTHRFPMERAVEAFETAADYSKGSIKCQIIM
jgi:threonine dehydrogenase-like Zn-dependent dehydrogenase